MAAISGAPRCADCAIGASGFNHTAEVAATSYQSRPGPPKAPESERGPCHPRGSRWTMRSGRACKRTEIARNCSADGKVTVFVTSIGNLRSRAATFQQPDGFGTVRNELEALEPTPNGLAPIRDRVIAVHAQEFESPSDWSMISADLAQRLPMPVSPSIGTPPCTSEAQRGK